MGKKSFKPNVSFNEVIEKSINTGENSIEKIELKNIVPNPDNPRKSFSDIDLLAESIQNNGLIQPIVVMPKPDDNDKYLIVAGERRFRAYQELNKNNSEDFAKINCIIMKDIDIQLLSLIENIQRKDLNPIEESKFITAIRKEKGLSQGKMAKTIGKSRDYIAKLESYYKVYMKLKELEIPDEVILKISKSHLINLSGRMNDEIIRAVNYIKDNSFNVSERALRDYLNKDTNPADDKLSGTAQNDLNLNDVGDKLSGTAQNNTNKRKRYSIAIQGKDTINIKIDDGAKLVRIKELIERTLDDFSF